MPRLPHALAPTLREVADAAGVSIGTTSMALSGNRLVASGTRERINRLAQQMGYEPNHVARSLRARRLNALGIVIPHSSAHVFSHPYFMEVLRGVCEVASDRGFTVTISVSQAEDSTGEAYRKILESRRVDGVIIASASLNDPNLASLARSGYHAVMIGRYPLDPTLDAIGVDDRRGGWAATNHLLGHGHKLVAHVSGPAGHLSAIDRVEGYRDALGEHDVAYHADLVVEGDYSTASGYAAGLQLLRRKDRPTGVFAANDEMAFGLMQAARELGMEVPGELALVGFDDLQLASVMRPALTTIRQPIARLGAEAAARLIDLVLGTSNDRQQILRATELVVRESCGCSAPPTAGVVSADDDATGNTRIKKEGRR
jgi:DNA-binding LacI/PurR family transcriptional regulator